MISRVNGDKEQPPIYHSSLATDSHRLKTNFCTKTQRPLLDRIYRMLRIYF